VGRYGLDASGSVVGCCENHNEPLSPYKVGGGRGFLTT
jgi:hypothetical protein